jgi:hypothetical protein
LLGIEDAEGGQLANTTPTSLGSTVIIFHLNIFLPRPPIAPRTFHRTLVSAPAKPPPNPHPLETKKMPYNSNRLTSRIAIVGVGDVGAAAAYALILGSVAGEILLVDTKEQFRDGQVLDLSDATFCGNSGVRVGAATHAEAGQCDIVVVTAGAKQKPGEFREEVKRERRQEERRRGDERRHRGAGG